MKHSKESFFKMLDLMSSRQKQIMLELLLDGGTVVIKDFTYGKNKVCDKTARGIINRWVDVGIVTKLKNENCIGKEGLFRLNPQGVLDYLNCQ